MFAGSWPADVHGSVMRLADTEVRWVVWILDVAQLAGTTVRTVLWIEIDRSADAGG